MGPSLILSLLTPPPLAHFNSGNETVTLGDTAIGSCMSLWGGGRRYSSTTQMPSAKICKHFNLVAGEEGVVQTNSNPKCQDLPKFSLRAGGRGGVTQGVSNQNFWKPSLLLHRR